MLRNQSKAGSRDTNGLQGEKKWVWNRAEIDTALRQLGDPGRNASIAQSFPSAAPFQFLLLSLEWSWTSAEIPQTPQHATL